MIAVRRPLLAPAVVVALVVLLAVAGLAGLTSVRAGAAGDRCDRYAAASRARATAVTGTGARVVVIGDSWSAGLGLGRPADSWPSRLPGAVHVAGFSGSGFSADASPCVGVSFAERAPAALRGGADLVVVEGGLNDYDQPVRAIDRGFRNLMADLAGQHVVIVGPATAPLRARAVPRVDDRLEVLADLYGVPYVRTSDLDLAYLDDGLHLTEDGHREFGDAVAERLADVTPTRPALLGR